MAVPFLNGIDVTGQAKAGTVLVSSGSGGDLSLVPGVTPQITVTGAGRIVEIYNLTDAKPYVRYQPDIFGVPSISVGSITISNGPGYPATPANDAVQLISSGGKLQPIYRDFSGFASAELSSLRLVKGGFFSPANAFTIDCVSQSSDRGWLFPNSNPTAGQIPYVVSIASGIATIGYKNEAGGGGGTDQNYFVGGIGDGNGSSVFFNLADNFTTVPLNAISDPAGKWSATNRTWEVPVTGLYEINTKVRARDGLSARGFGHGAHTSNSDGAWFLWDSTRQSSGGFTNRSGSLNSRTAVFNAGDLIRMYGYGDIAGGVDCAAAEMSIVLLKAG